MITPTAESSPSPARVSPEFHPSPARVRPEVSPSSAYPKSFKFIHCLPGLFPPAIHHNLVSDVSPPPTHYYGLTPPSHNNQESPSQWRKSWPEEKERTRKESQWFPSLIPGRLLWQSSVLHPPTSLLPLPAARLSPIWSKVQTHPSKS